MSTAIEAGVSDEELAVMFKAGDEDAFVILFTRWNERLTRFCFGLLGDWHLAEECASDVFLMFHKGRDSLDTSYRVASWMFRWARYRSINVSRCRQTRRRRERASDVSVSLAVASTPTPVVEVVEREAVAEEAANAKAIAERIPEALTPTQAEAVVRVYFEGMTLREAAGARGCSPQAVDCNLQYAIVKLRVDPVLSSIAALKKRTPPAPLRLPKRELTRPARPSRPVMIQAAR